jgi:hypothetical protein
MFEFLMQQSFEVAAPAIHHSIQWVRQWAAASKHLGNLSTIDDPDVASAKKLVIQIVKVIQTREGMPVADLLL